ncbi:hypothetical protein DIS24_g4727 [Lasiodiplodia hormozganensis]|uniref:F-box domain-containing protein n=1 Tax=Lasiodiplodia hormozganensis TaxID=869390 RepID=A0AA40D2U9_9PEZI|nr:hypothetical protein DIS24_g4727 [Lasiodiplodia hormozganensis]
MQLIALALNHKANSVLQHPVQTKDDNMAVHHAQSALEAADIPGNLPYQTEDTIAHPPYRKISLHFPFFKLPPEMRLIIYEHLLVFPDKGIVRIEPKSDHEASKHSCQADRNSSVLRNRALNVLLASKAVFAEAAKVFYSNSHFEFDDNPGRECNSTLTCQAFLTSRSSFTLKYIKSVGVSIILDRISDTDPNAKALGSLVNTLNNDLPAFEQLILAFYGTCPETRRTPWNWYPPNDEDDHPQKWFGVLLELRKVNSLGIYYDDCEAYNLYPYNDEDLEHARECIGRSVAFVRFLRAHLLKNANELGTRNIYVHSRHHATVQQELWKRKMDRRTVVFCCDSENGASFIPPSKVRLSPRHIGVLEKCVKEEKDPKEFEEDLRSNIAADDDYLGYSIVTHDGDLDQTLEQDMSDTEDWDMSDNGDNDSLKDVDLRNINCTFVNDEEFFKTYHQLPG